MSCFEKLDFYIVALFNYSIKGCKYCNLISHLAVKLIKDEITKRPKAYAFIQYTCQDDAIIALENMDQKVLLCHLPLFSGHQS